MARTPSNETLLLAATALVGIAGFAGVLLWWMRQRRPAGTAAPKAARSKTMEHPCENCGRTMIFAPGDLSPLSPSEVGLVVRTAPKWLGRKLAEIDCPYCGASHCFAVDRKPIQLAGCDLYTPQTGAGRCVDCRTPLGTPPWAAGTYDGRFEEVPELRPNFGLVCERCQAVCCVACCQKATRGRTKDGSLLCPRCFRGPLAKIYTP